MLKNKVALITGASSGIGYATSVALSKAGAHVAAGARRAERLKELEKEVSDSRGAEILIHDLDVTDRANCNSFVDAVVKKWGTVDILVNNAGLMPL
ncbi:MAG: SDR family NAD(P)-dependent oxidoreductase, partial [Nitrososphaeraceae archaeon]